MRLAAYRRPIRSELALRPVRSRGKPAPPADHPSSPSTAIAHAAVREAFVDAPAGREGFAAVCGRG